ncbi:hypothetical protein [Qipengyuania sp. 902]|uniref:hypothetical protein n=1 Tax=Qipengyuania sp. 902 TaxID=3417565 RepID=UPI003EBF659F
MTWVAFGSAITVDHLRTQVEGHCPLITDDPAERSRKFFAGHYDEVGKVPGLEFFKERQSGLDRLTEAWNQLRNELERGAVKVRGRFTPTYSLADAHLAGLEDLTANLLGTFSQFDVSTGGIRRQPPGSPDVLWQNDPRSFDREYEAFGDDARAADGYLLVEVCRADLLKAFPARIEGTERPTMQRKRRGPAPDPDWPHAIAKVTQDCVAAGYKCPLKRGDKAAIQIMLLNFMAEKDKHFSDDTAAKYATAVIARLPDK